MYWNNQFTTYVIGSSASAATLTTAYAGNTTTQDVQGYKLVTLYVEYTPGENDSDAYIQLEAGPDSATLFPKTALLDLDTSGESSTRGHIFKFEAAVAGTAIKRRILIDLADVKLRISAKEVTSGNAGTIKILMCRNEQWSNR